MRFKFCLKEIRAHWESVPRLTAINTMTRVRAAGGDCVWYYRKPLQYRHEAWKLNSTRKVKLLEIHHHSIIEIRESGPYLPSIPANLRGHTPYSAVACVGDPQESRSYVLVFGIEEDCTEVDCLWRVDVRQFGDHFLLRRDCSFTTF